MGKELTDKQAKIFGFIKESIRESGFPPTVREIGERFSITVKGAYDHLKAIEKKEYIRCNQNKSRAIEVLKERDEFGNPNTITIPLIGRIAAGSPIIAEENIEEHLSFPSSAFGSGEYFALNVHGNSMLEKGILDGDIAIIKKQNSANNGDIVAAMIGEEATLKIFKRNNKNITLHPANPAYKPIINDFVILGTLTGIFRKY